MVCGGGGTDGNEHRFEVSRPGIERVGASNAPDVVADRHVTFDAGGHVNDTVVTRAFAGGGDSFVCDGTLADVRTDPGTSVYLDGTEIETPH